MINLTDLESVEEALISAHSLDNGGQLITMDGDSVVCRERVSISQNRGDTNEAHHSSSPELDQHKPSYC